MKTCTKCNVEKALTEFYKKRNGLESGCKTCRKIRSDARYLAKRDKILAKTREYQKAHPEVAKASTFRRRGKIKEYQKSYYAANKDRVLEKGKLYYKQNKERHNALTARYYQDNKDHILAKCRLWKQAHPEKVRIFSINRRAIKANTEWLALYASFGNKCLSCGIIPGKLTVDHVKPLSKGGTNSLDNIQPLCGPCNSRKHVKEVDFRSIYDI